MHERISLRAATADDIVLLEHWDKQPHVIAANGAEPWDWQQDFRTPSEWREVFIAQLDERPLGFLQIIDPAREALHYWGDCGPDLRAIDIWIGAGRDLGRGYGTQMMRLALRHCFRDPRVKAVIIDPLASNTAAHRFYRRFGFRFVERRWFGTDDTFVFRLERDDYLPPIIRNR